MDILYIGPYRQNDEWGQTSKGFATVLTRLDNINLTLRPIWFNGDNRSINMGALEEYEQNEVKDKDILIQHGLPSYLNYNGSFKKNIAITSIDCRIDNTDWVTHLNLFDHVVVFSKHEKELLEMSGVTSDIIGLSHSPVCMDQAKQEIDIDFTGTKFYTEGSLDLKSGLYETIAAYLSAFSILDDVVLAVATNYPQEVEDKVNQIKAGLGKFKDNKYYPHIAVVGSAETSVMNALHEYCDFFINVSYNMRATQDLLKSLLHDSLPIMLDTVDIIKDWPFYAESYSDLCIYNERPIDTLYSGEYTWAMPVMYKLQETLSMAHEKMASNDLDREREMAYKFKSTMFTELDKQVGSICTL